MFRHKSKGKVFQRFRTAAGSVEKLGGGLTLRYVALPYLKGGCMPWQTPSADATARAQCASPTDLKVDRTSWSFGKPHNKKAMDVTAAEAAEVASVVEARLPARGHKWHWHGRRDSHWGLWLGSCSRTYPPLFTPSRGGTKPPAVSCVER